MVSESTPRAPTARLRVVAARQRSLPMSPAPLIGREEEVERVRTNLLRADVRLLTLTGPPGVGKTRLAVEVANSLVEAFPDGVFFVDLAPLGDAALVISSVARTLGIDETGGQPFTERVSDQLNGKQLLLVLDNFEHLLGAAPDVAELLAASPAVKVLVTSRAALQLRWEHQFAVPPLPLPRTQHLPDTATLASTAAVALFVQRAQAARADFALTDASAPAVVEICRRLDGLPLAIELAAARVKVLPPRAMLRRLQGGLLLLAGGPRDLPARHQTLRDAISWSHDLLSDAQRTLFRRLAVFAGGASLAAIAVIVGEPGDSEIDVLERLGDLVDANLLWQEEESEGEPRFRMLETLREYARERLEDSGEADAIHRRHAEYFVALAEEAEPRLKSGARGAWLARLDAELDNIRATLTWCQTDPTGTAVGLRLAAAMEWYWHFRNRWHEGRGWLEPLLARRGPEVSSWTRTKALYVAGRLALFANDRGAARTRLEEAAVGWRDLGHADGLAFATMYLGRLSRAEGDLPVARTRAQESEALFLEAGDAWGRALAVMHAGGFARDAGDLDAARVLSQQAAALFRDLGDAWGVGVTQDTVVGVAVAQGDYAAARAMIEDMLHARRALGVKMNIFASLCNLGDMLALQGESARAAEHYREALAISEEQGDPEGAASVLRRLGYLALDEHDHEQAAARLMQSLDIIQRRRGARGFAPCLAALAQLAARQGHQERAARLMGAAEANGQPSSAPFDLIDSVAYRRALAALEHEHSDVAYRRWRVEGRVMPLEEVVAYALAPATALIDPPRPPKNVPSPLPNAHGSLASGHRTHGDADRLTGREVEVLRLLAGGRSNTDIASELVLSVRTVERHIANIYEKLDLHGKAARAAASAYAVHQGLTNPPP